VPSAPAIPKIIDSGADAAGHWILIPFHDDDPAEAETLIPTDVITALPRMHVHYRECPIAGHIPVVDPSW
jgi:hypothetical protein